MNDMQSTNPKDKIGQKKPPMHLIPAPALVEEAMVMGLGASKYGPYNWREHSVAASVYIAAAYRHLMAWFDGQDTDAESGITHLAHARACLGILIDAQRQGKLVDDRPAPGATALLLDRHTKKDEPSTGTYDREMAAEMACHQETPPYGTLPHDAVYKEDDPNQMRVKQTYRPGRPLSSEEEDRFIEHFMEMGCNSDVARHIARGVTVPWDWQLRYETPSLVYIAGPMRGHVAYNYPAFDAARDRFLQAGYAVISPADIDRATSSHEHGDGSDQFTDAQNREFVYRDCNVIMNLGPDDAIAVLPGWEKSTGATAEVFLARWMKRRILDAETMKPLAESESFRVTEAIDAYLEEQR